ncbi:MAG: molybdenum cofactor guanylyltransferase [Myxococcota bacterium]
MIDGCAAIVMAGGRATRLGGVAKGLVVVGGETILERQLRVLRPLFAEIRIVANDAAPYARFGLPIVGDRVAGRGPLGGLEAALAAIDAPRAFVCACDMPSLREEAVRLVAEADRDADVVVPVVGGRPEPLHARYAKACLPAVQRALAEARLKMTSFFAELRVVAIDEARLRAIDPSLAFLRNVNAPEDL